MDGKATSIDNSFESWLYRETKKWGGSWGEYGVTGAFPEMGYARTHLSTERMIQ